VSWRPSLSDVGVPYQVTVRALKTEVGDPDQTWYTFTLTASSSTVVRRLDLSFSAAAAGGLADVNGLFTGLTTRLPGTGTALPALDPNLRLDPAEGVLALTTTRADFNGAAGLDTNSSPGVALADFGFTGSEDFAATVVFRPSPACSSSTRSASTWERAAGPSPAPAPSCSPRPSATPCIRRTAATIAAGSSASASTAPTDDGDHHPRRRRLAVLDRRRRVEPARPPAFLDGRPDLVVGLFAITPLNASAKTVEIDSFSLVVATSEPLPPAY
jgi:hypothetical protein